MAAGREYLRIPAHATDRGMNSMPYVMVDVEADGPIPGDYSMIGFGAVIVEPQR